MTIQVQITKIGENAMLPLSDELLKQIGVKVGEAVNLSIEDKKIVMRPQVQVDLEKRVDDIVTDLLERRASTYQKLAEGA